MKTEKKVVLYIDMMYRGGAQRVMANIANYLIEKQYSVVLVNDFEPDPDIMQYQVSDKVKRVFLRKDLRGNVVKKNIDRLLELRKIVKKENPDAVLSFLGRPNIRMLLSTLGLSYKKIVSVRNDPYKEYGSSALKKWIANLLFYTANGCVFQTEDASLYFSKTIREKSVVILNPVDDKFFNIIRENKVRNIITFGRLEPQKNHILLIHAFSKVADAFPNENLIIYGEGSLRKELEKEIKDNNLEGRVFLPGNTSNVEEKLSSAKLFVLSSDYEGLPNALMEAMAVGVPCVSTDCPSGGPKTLIIDNQQGLLIRCNDAEKMAEAIKQVLSDSSAEAMGLAAKERAQVFRGENILRQWEEFIFG